MTGQPISLAATGATARGRKRKNIRSESAPPSQSAKAQPARAPRPADLPAGWRVIAAKEFADHVSSIRFLVLTLVLTLAAAASVYSAAGGLRTLASSASGVESLQFAFGAKKQ